MEDGEVLARLDERTKFMAESQTRIEEKVCKQDERIGNTEKDIVRLNVWTKITAGFVGVGAVVASLLRQVGVI